MSHSALPSGMVRFWEVICCRAVASIFSSSADRSLRIFTTSRRIVLGSSKISISSSASIASTIRWESWVTFSWLSFIDSLVEFLDRLDCLAWIVKARQRLGCRLSLEDHLALPHKLPLHSFKHL